MDRDVDLDRLVERGLESGIGASVPLATFAEPGRGSLVLVELLPVELLVLPRDVHPEAAFSAYRAGAVDLEANAVGGHGGWRQVDVLATGEIRRAVILERKIVHVVMVHLGELPDVYFLLSEAVWSL